MNLRRWIGSLALGTLAAAAVASPLNYAQRSTEIRAGVLLLESQVLSSVPVNPTPHVFYNLDNNRAVKPAGWTFVNPLAPSIVSAATIQRWSLLVGAGNVPGVGTPITKRDAPYWEVRLRDLNDDQLSRYDVLYVPTYRPVGGGAGSFPTQLNPLERERMRRFVDQGGVLWIDVSGLSSIDVVGNFPLPFVRTNTGGGTNVDAAYEHPLLSTPYPLTGSALVAMQNDTSSLAPVRLNDAGLGAIAQLLSSLEAESARLLPVVTSNGAPVVLVGRIGDGFMLVTARGVGQTLNRSLVAGVFNPNEGYTSLEPNFNRSTEAAGRLLVNAVSMTSSYAQAAAGSRKTSSNAIPIGAPLLKRFDVPVPNSNPAGSFNPPASFKGLLVVSGTDRVYVLNARPGTDLDGDGNLDQGIPDYNLGENRDVIWQSQVLPGPLSAPTTAEISDTVNGMPTNQIIVVDGNGTVHGFNAFPTDANGRLQGSTAATPAYSVSPPGGASVLTGGPGGGPYPVTIHEGLGFVADSVAGTGRNVGRVWVLDPGAGTRLSRGGNDWLVGGGGQDFVNELSAAPTVGYLPIQDNSGGVDRVVYVPSFPVSGVGGGANGTAGINSFWFGARGERPSVVQFDSATNSLLVTTRASLQGLPIYLPNGSDPLGVKLTVLRPNGAPLTGAEMATIFSGAVTQTGGLLTFALNTGQSLPTNFSVRVDYTIDWGTGQPSLTGQILRGQLFLPDDTSRLRRILGPIAMSPQGTLYVTTGTQPNLFGFGAPPAPTQGDAYYAIRELGRGAFRMVTRFTLAGPHSMNLNQATASPVPTTFTDRDGVVNFAPVGGDFTHYALQGPPVVRGDTVYVTATGRKTGPGFPPRGFIPFTIVMAFRAEPDVIEIQTPDLGDGFSLLQPDFTRSSNKAAPEQLNVLQPGQFTYERRRGASFGLIRFDSLMSTDRGPVQNAFSLSQPIIVRRPAQPDLVIEPDRTNGRWSPLRWYTVVHGVNTTGAPMVAGSDLFLGGSSVFPSLLRGDPNLRGEGVLNAIDTRIAPNDPFLVGDPNRPWLRQLMRIRTSPSFAASPNWIWPQASGTTSFDDFRVRLLQTSIPQTPAVLGVAAGDGGMFAWSEDGVWAYSRADFLVADEGRIARFDSSGNPIWTSDAFVNSGINDASSAATVRPLVRPTRAYRIGDTDQLVVDSGANRVIRLSSAGREVRSIDGLLLDPAFRPEGFGANDSVALNGPRDVVSFTSYQANPSWLSNAQPLEFWRHYVIADAGNRRLVEVVDRYVADPNTRRVGDPVYINGVPQLGVLTWHSPATFSGRQFSYVSVERVWIEAGANSRYVYVAGVGGNLPTRANTGLDAPSADPTQLQSGADGNGGIVIFDPLGSENNAVINRVSVPEIGQNVFWNDVAGNFSSPLVPERNAANGTQKALGPLNSVTARYVDGQLAIMFTDPSGVYEVVQVGNEWVVRWMILRENYRVMRGFIANSLGTVSGAPSPGNPLDFRPTYARRLDSGEVLVVNGYQGTTRGVPTAGGTFDRGSRTTFLGEIVQLDGDVNDLRTPSGFNFRKPNFGFVSASVRFELPPVQGARGITLPVFADRR